jgi:hypothetical protein
VKYWYYYSSEEFSARVIRAKDDWSPAGDDPKFSGHYHGPFGSARQARIEVREKIYGDIQEFKTMLHTVNGPLSRVGGDK